MGIFDFFKKRNTNQNNTQFTKEEVDKLVMTALNLLCDDISTVEDAKTLIKSQGYDDRQTTIIVSRANELYLKHFKNEKNKTLAQTKESVKQEPKKSINEIYAEKLKNKEQVPYEKLDVILDDTGSHGDNFGGLLGFNFLNSQQGNQFINEMMALTAIQKPISENPIFSISEVNFKETNGDSDLIKMRAIKARGQMLSAFPYLKTNYVLPFETKQIIEWSHVAKLEAEIKGGGRDTFGLAFFATDYAENRNIYKSTKKLNIHISAFGLVLDKSDLTEINGTKVSSDFATYMPSKDIPRPTYYDFIGILNDFKECKLTNENTGYIINVKLINQEDQPDFFTVDMFINRENMRITELKKGMKVAGALWFQGEIA